MQDKDIWESAKTASFLVGGVLFSFTAVIALDYFGYIQIGIEIDQKMFMMLLGALMASGLTAFFIDQMEWI